MNFLKRNHSLIKKPKGHEYSVLLLTNSFCVNAVFFYQVKFTSTNFGADKARRNIFKILLYVVIAHMVCWTLNQFLYIVSMFGLPTDSTSVPFYMSQIGI